MGCTFRTCYSTQGRLCAVSGRHGSIASCASLPDVNSLPHTVLGMTTMSRQASEAQSSSFDGQADQSQSQATADSQLPALPDTRLPLKYTRAASWGPQGTPHNTRVSFQKCSCLYSGHLRFCCFWLQAPFMRSCLPVLSTLDALGNQPVGLQLFCSGLQYVTETPGSNVCVMMVHACGHMGVGHLVQCSIVACSIPRMAGKVF